MVTSARHDCVAVLLAAGVGRRLGGTHDGPKVLLEFGGETLLQRHIKALWDSGVRRLSITVGFEAERVRQAARDSVSRLDLQGFELGFVDNADYTDGSLVSLHRQRAVLEAAGEVLLMDGDVLYDVRMLERLLGA